MESADTVNVIRCKDCRWYHGDWWEPNDNKRQYWCGRISELGRCIYVKADDFCSYGERKESE